MTRPRITVLGTGYLGATHAAGMAELGFEVLGFDIDQAKIDALHAGQVPFYEPDLEPVLRDAIVVELPLTPLCEANCPGLCVDCGERLVIGQPKHDHPVLDPRWAALEAFATGPDEAADSQG